MQCLTFVNHVLNLLSAANWRQTQTQPKDSSIDTIESSDHVPNSHQTSVEIFSHWDHETQVTSVELGLNEIILVSERKNNLS